MRTEQTPWSVVLMALLGALGFVFAASLGWWWLAHQMAWWAFAAWSTGFQLLYQAGRVVVKESRQ